MTNFEIVAKDVVKVCGQWELIDHKIGAVIAVLRFYAGSLEWFKEVRVGEYLPSMPDPCAPEDIAKQIIDDISEEPYGCLGRTSTLLREWANLLIASKTPNTDFNLTTDKPLQVKS